MRCSRYNKKHSKEQLLPIWHNPYGHHSFVPRRSITTATRLLFPACKSLGRHLVHNGVVVHPLQPFHLHWSDHRQVWVSTGMMIALCKRAHEAMLCYEA